MKRPQTLVPDWLNRRARTHADHPAIIAEGRAVTYAALARRAHAASERIGRLGVQRGDRVAVLLRGGLDFVDTMYGLMRCGAIAC